MLRCRRIFALCFYSYELIWCLRVPLQIADGWINFRRGGGRSHGTSLFDAFVKSARMSRSVIASTRSHFGAVLLRLVEKITFATLFALPLSIREISEIVFRLVCGEACYFFARTFQLLIHSPILLSLLPPQNDKSLVKWLEIQVPTRNILISKKSWWTVWLCALKSIVEKSGRPILWSRTVFP